MSNDDRFFVDVYASSNCDDCDTCDTCDCFSCDSSCHCECDGGGECDWG